MKPRAAVSVPASVTEVEQRSVVEAVSAAGVRRVVLIEEAVAAAIGAGLDVSAARGSMAVNIGRRYHRRGGAVPERYLHLQLPAGGGR